MRVLLTGGSSFTGYWFAAKLKAAGFEVGCTFAGHSLELRRCSCQARAKTRGNC